MGVGLYFSLTCEGEAIFTNLLCNCDEAMPPFPTSKFRGRFRFLDTKGTEHPEYSGLGDRFILTYESER